MLNQHLLYHAQGPIAQAGVIGTGHFATAVVTQAQSMAQLAVRVVVDLKLAAAQSAYARAGIPEAAIAICENRRAALDAWERQKYLILTDAMLLLELPVDVVVEATGVPEAGARHALAVIEHGKHVVMVTKETDAVVGPLLAHLAAQAGVVYAQADGDQHGLLIDLVHWARTLGLEVLCGGKARDAEFVYTPDSATITCGRHTVQPPTKARQWLQPVAPGEAAAFVAARQELCASLPQVGGFDLVELAIAANATGLIPDVETTHCAALHIAELPEVFCPMEEGGILQRRGVIDCVTCLRQPHEAGLGGGVFIVVACTNEYSRHILHTKGLIPNSRGTAAVIYRPYHLCGVETPLSILRAALLGADPNLPLPRPVVDVVARARRTLGRGAIMGNDHSPELQARLRPAGAVVAQQPLPLHMANGNVLQYDVAEGQIIEPQMVIEPPAATLWRLRRQLDQHFGLGVSS
ncbi:MAG: hypothetical protein R3C14_51785 [Caldilineaceae bacterium]